MTTDRQCPECGSWAYDPANDVQLTCGACGDTHTRWDTTKQRLAGSTFECDCGAVNIVPTPGVGV